MKTKMLMSALFAGLLTSASAQQYIAPNSMSVEVCWTKELLAGWIYEAQQANGTLDPTDYYHLEVNVTPDTQNTVIDCEVPHTHTRVGLDLDEGTYYARVSAYKNNTDVNDPQYPDPILLKRSSFRKIFVWSAAPVVQQQELPLFSLENTDTYQPGNIFEVDLRGQVNSVLALEKRWPEYVDYNNFPDEGWAAGGRPADSTWHWSLIFEPLLQLPTQGQQFHGSLSVGHTLYGTVCPAWATLWINQGGSNTYDWNPGGTNPYNDPFHPWNPMPNARLYLND